MSPLCRPGEGTEQFSLDCLDFSKSLLDTQAGQDALSLLAVVSNRFIGIGKLRELLIGIKTMDQVLNFLDDLTNGELTNLRAEKVEADLRAEKAIREKAEADLRTEKAIREKAEADLRTEKAIREKAEADLKAERATREKEEADLRADLKAERAAREKTVFKMRLNNIGFSEISSQTGFNIAEIEQILA
jgi:hypothetical protein